MIDKSIEQFYKLFDKMEKEFYMHPVDDDIKECIRFEVEKNLKITFGEKILDYIIVKVESNRFDHSKIEINFLNKKTLELITSDKKFKNFIYEYNRNLYFKIK